MNLVRTLVVVGSVCEFLGISIVFLQIAARERTFSLPGWVKQARLWLWRHRPRRHSTQVVSLSGHATVSLSASAAGRVFRNREGDSTTQLRALWASIDDLYKEMDSLHLQDQAALREHQRTSAEQHVAVIGQLSTLETKIQEVALGSRGSQIIGAVLIIAGICLLALAAWWA